MWTVFLSSISSTDGDKQNSKKSKINAYEVRQLKNCNKPWEANSSLSGLTYILWMPTVNKIKHSEDFKLLRSFPSRRWIYTDMHPVLRLVWTRPRNWSKHAFGKWEKPPFQTKRKCEAENIQKNVGIWKRKDCIHYHHQGCTGNMNSSNSIDNSHLFKQIPPLILMDTKWWIVINLGTS